MNHKPLIRAITGMLALLCLAALAAPAVAASRPAAARHAVTIRRAQLSQIPRRRASALAGYLWSTSVTNSGPVAAYYAYTSSGGAVSVTNPRTGEYIADFNGLGLMTSPAIDVTTYGTQATCSLAEAGAGPGGWGAVILCFSLTGPLVEARFDLTVGQPIAAPSGVLDYAFVVHPARSGPLTGQYQYNSSHKTNRIRHLGTGRYQVTMPGPATTGTTGTVKVTPVILTPGDCEIAGWHGTRTGQVINVDCYSATGTPQNHRFLITYARGNNLMGLSGATTANAYANRPTATQYQPGTQYDSHRHARVTSVRLGQGIYQVIFRRSEGPGSLNGGDVQVSAVGHADDHCYVVYWAQQQQPYARVACVNNLGAPTDSAFTIQWVVA